MGGEKLNKGIYFKYILDDINSRINDMNLDNVNKTKINDENKDNQTINNEQLKNFKNKSKFITNNVTNMSNMFFGCSSLKSINLSNFDTNNVKDMSGMFSGCSSLTSLNLNNFDANNITNKIVDEIPKSCKINENDKN